MKAFTVKQLKEYLSSLPPEFDEAEISVGFVYEQKILPLQEITTGYGHSKTFVYLKGCDKK